MGYVRHAGPVYGAKSLLASFGPYAQTGTTGASTVLYLANSAYVVPPYEDWFITECRLTASTNSSVAAGHGVYVKSEGGSTVVPNRPDGKASTVAQTIFSFSNAAGSTTWSTWATAGVTPGEVEGTYVPAGSSLRIVSSGITSLGGLQLSLMGYIRYIDSTRAI